MLLNILLNNNSYILEHKKVEFSVQKCQVLLNNYYKLKKLSYLPTNFVKTVKEGL
jgi:hypothetical protein